MYQLNEFKTLGLYQEKPIAKECEFGEGKVIKDPRVSERILKMLKEPGGDSHGGDFSRQDSAVITALISARYSPSDVYFTFLASARGRHAEQRKEGHVEDYVRRTIQKALGFIESGSDKFSVDFSKKRKDSKATGIVISMASEVQVEKVHWLWPGYIPSGKLTILAGDPGMGKSTIAVDLVSRISRGTLLPSGNRGVTGTTLIASAEDAAEDTITPRLIAAQANLSRVGIIREVKNDIGEPALLSLPRDLELLKAELSNRGCRVLIVDPLNAFLGKDTDTYNDHDMRLVLHPLEAIAEETGTAILVVAHLTKKEDAGTLYRVGGSIGFIGAARSVLAVTRIKDGTRVMYSLKSNLSARPPSLSYETKQVRKQRTNGQWLGEEVVNSSGIRWLGEVEFDPFAKAIDHNEGTETATEFLKQVLQEAGEMTTDELFKEARIAGVPKAHLTKLRPALGIKAVKRREQWIWIWPEKK